MISRDPSCVYVAANAAEAAVVANWLEHQDVPARVMETMTHGGLEGLTAWTGVSARGIEIWVERKEDTDRARVLLAEHKQTISSLLAHKESAGPVDAICEDCGQTSEFPGGLRGTVQNCPNCGGYLDVPEVGSAKRRAPRNQRTASRRAAKRNRSQRGADTPQLSRLRSIQKPIILFILAIVAIPLLLHLWAVLATVLGR
jgi:hypothetical protein